jgi:putative ABC transport system permease protein
VWIGNGDPSTTTQTEHYVDVRQLSQSLSDVAGWFNFDSPGDTQLAGTGEPERITSVSVTDNSVSLLGVEPVLGRSFTAVEAEGRYLAPSAIVLSDGFWHRRFGGAPSVVGRTLTLNNSPATVVGVLPASFDFSTMFSPGRSIDVFVPWPLHDM